MPKKNRRMIVRESDAPSKGEIAIYRSTDRKIELQVTLERETIWLGQADIAHVFGADRSVITKHISNIFKSGELVPKSNVQKMHIPFSDKPVNFYSLDVIISVGYRVNSTRATQFRIWATQVLRKHLIDGYTINDRRLAEERSKLKELQHAIKLIGGMKGRKELDYSEALGLIDVIHDYSYALGVLDDYDHGRLSVSKTSKEAKFRITYEKASKAVHELRTKFSSSSLFGKEKDQSFKSSIAAIYQTFGGKELYPSIEEKAAHLLYFIVKNHSFVDGNKRIAASIFLWFLQKNGLLYRKDRSKRIADNALVALTLMIAESNPREKDTIAKIIVNLINKNN